MADNGELKVLSDAELDEIAGGAATASYVSHRVRRGETLTSIGEEYGISWQKIYARNRDLIKNPSFIMTGWVLKIPMER